MIFSASVSEPHQCDTEAFRSELPLTIPCKGLSVGLPGRSICSLTVRQSQMLRWRVEVLRWIPHRIGKAPKRGVASASYYDHLEDDRPT